MPLIRLAVALIATSLSYPAIARDFIGENCGLRTPPPSSGEIFFQVDKVSVNGYVYPRLSQLPSRYTGCQVNWLSSNGGPVTRVMTLFDSGRVVAVDPIPDGIPLCKAGEKVADTGCTSRKMVVLVSYPAGCAARVRETKALPKDCLEALQAEFKLQDRITD